MFHNYKPLPAVFALLGLLVLAGCASQFRKPDAPLTIEVRSVDFVTGSAEQIRFDANGFVRNSNELVVKSVGFTYQTFIENELVSSGNIDVPIGFPFKSRTPFIVPVRIPTNKIGGFVNATISNGVSYRIDLQLTDERYKRITLVQSGILNLAPILNLPTIDTKLTNIKDQLVADTTIFNPNPFILLVDSCSINFAGLQVPNELFATGALPTKGNRSFRVALPVSAKRGQSVQVVNECVVNGTPIEELQTVVVK